MGVSGFDLVEAKQYGDASGRSKIIQGIWQLHDYATRLRGVRVETENFLLVYVLGGHRRLAAKTYETSCSSCIWATKMPTRMIIDQWNPSKVKWRFETLCYGPTSYRIYNAGPTRKVPGRRGMSWTEEDWVDEDATAHRSPDE